MYCSELFELLVNQATFGLWNVARQDFLLELHTYRDSIVKNVNMIELLLLR